MFSSCVNQRQFVPFDPLWGQGNRDYTAYFLAVLEKRYAANGFAFH